MSCNLECSQVYGKFKFMKCSKGMFHHTLFTCDAHMHILVFINVQIFHLCICFILDLEVAIAYWNIVFKGRFKFLDLWVQFLTVSDLFLCFSNRLLGLLIKFMILQFLLLC